MADSRTDPLVGENRCWACTISNGIVAAIIAGVPLYGALQNGGVVVTAVTAVWSAAVMGYALLRLILRGYLPGSEQIAKKTGLHERIGPETQDEDSGF
jgi:hypothetical protein